MIIYPSTWLYIKQHNKTGLKYFGMTRNKDPVKYRGSGKYWAQHLKLHGKDVTTIWCQLFDNEQDIIDYAHSFSIENNIVESKEWANLIPETGDYNKKGGGFGGRQHTVSAKEKISKAGMGRPGPRSMLNRLHKESSKAKCSNTLMGRKFDKNYSNKTWKITSAQCDIIVNNLRQWCNENNLNYHCAHRNARAQKPYKGYYIVECN